MSDQANYTVIRDLHPCSPESASLTVFAVTSQAQVELIKVILADKGAS